ncbi:hypothetical protein Saso_04180 [Streptomyces asoensis]|uniref:Uncharacterized protein n=1 Tax=Streptomyces asoensis TaxID=249586 RepID=A0ABQ3RSC1_9ACTN|nr:hypothetical protein GCM10010496_05100 [Streptomyces asoensis]GHI58768.1 hypothetical protein Saso_04180 [Streptomyces asoensis]
MQKSTGPTPSPPSRVSAAIDGLCAAVLRNNEETLSAMEPPYGAGPAGTTGPVVMGGPRGGARAALTYEGRRTAVQPLRNR